MIVVKVFNVKMYTAKSNFTVSYIHTLKSYVCIYMYLYVCINVYICMYICVHLYGIPSLPFNTKSNGRTS